MKVAWISYFPVEWLATAPEIIQKLPCQHPATWQRVLLEEFETSSDLEIHVYAIRTRLAKDVEFKLGKTTIHCIRVPRGMRTPTLYWWETRLLRRHFAALKPDLVHAWGAERGAALVASRLGRPYLVTMQGLLQWYGTTGRRTVYERLEAYLEHVALRRASVITTESTFGVEWLGRRYPNLQIQQAEHAPNRMFFDVKREPEPDFLNLLYVGTCTYIKGTDLLLQGVDQLFSEKRNWRLRIVGAPTPEFLRELRSKTSPGIWERIELIGRLSSNEILALMRQATLLLFPTRADTSPNTVKEAAVAGLPVVASKVGGIPDYVRSGKNGILFEPNSLEAFVKALQRATQHPLFSLGKVDPITLNEIRGYLSPTLMGKKFQQAYGTVLGLSGSTQAGEM